MILSALAVAFVLGLLRWRPWTVPLLVLLNVFVGLGIGSGWNFAVWKPFGNPVFVDLVLKLLLANAVACVLGYGSGRLFVTVADRIRSGSSSAAPPGGPTPRR